jgi:hypothetical protein
MTTLTALALAGLLVACGSDGDGADAASDEVASASDDETDGRDASDDEADAEQELLDWVECMRDEGVDIPDPTRDADGNLVINGDGFRIGGGDGPTTNDAGDAADEPSITPEQMEAAEETCGPPPGLGPGDISDEDRQAMQDDALEFAQCMRDQGIEDFPDPDFSNMGPGGEPQTRSSDGDDGDGGGDGAGGGDSDGDGRDETIVLGPFGEIDLDDPEIAAAFEACQDLIGGPPGGDGGPAGSEPSSEGATT